MKKRLLLLGTIFILFVLITTGCKVQSVEQYHGIDENIEIDDDIDIDSENNIDKNNPSTKNDNENSSVENELSNANEPLNENELSNENENSHKKDTTRDKAEEENADREEEKTETGKKQPDKNKETVSNASNSDSPKKNTQETKAASAKKDTENKDKKSENPTPSSEKVESTKSSKENSEQYVTISIRCDTILDNYDKLDPALQKEKFVPSNGVILKKTQFPLEAGENVFDILVKATRKHRIHMEYQGADQNQYGSVYVQGINNLYEFSCGDLSGWMYHVNGTYPNVGASVYEVKDGDHIQWNYTCDLGRDLGVDWLD